MIEGTKQFRRKNFGGTTHVDKTLQTAESVTELPEELQKEKSGVENSARRELFQSILPAAGAGLAKILRASNLLKHELKDALKDK